MRIARITATVLAVVAAGCAPAAAATGSTIAWHSCVSGPDDPVGTALDGAGAQCGEVVVPLDHAAPGGATISIAVARRPAGDPAARRGTLVVDTGGPGPSRDGVRIIAQGDPELAPGGQPDLARHYDLVGFDPRFFGASAPLDCGWPTDVAFRNVQTAAPDRASFTASVAAARELAKRCSPQADRLPFASTRDVARDLDAVRAALGEERISYLGWSWGAYLGAVYLQMFPGRTDRVALDSPIGPTAAGPHLTREVGPADEAALRDWASWAAAHDTHGLGGTADAVLATIARIRSAAPLRVGNVRVSAQMLPGLLLTGSDSDDSYAAFSGRVAALRDAAAGRPVEPSPDLTAMLGWFTERAVLPELGLAPTAANQCADGPAERDPESYFADIQAHRAAEPLYGPLFRRITPCAFWPVTPREPRTVIDTDGPALVVGASGDPGAPYPGQVAMHAALRGSRMVTLDGAFRHGVYLSGSACADAATTGYLLGDPLPQQDVTCRAH